MKKYGIGAVLVLGIAAVWLLRFGFLPIKTTEIKIQPSAHTNWDQVFQTKGALTLEAWQTGTIQVKDRAQFLNRKAEKFRAFKDNKRSVPVWVYHLQHPRFGDILIDTGFDRSFSTKQKGNYNQLGRFYTQLVGVRHEQQKGQSLDEHLAQANVNPKKIFLTHLHFDHAAGLPAVSEAAEIILGKGELDFVSRVSAGHYLIHRTRLDVLDIRQGQTMPPFDRAVDLLGDGSLWAIQTHGHTAGHLSYLILTTSGPALITGDACFYYQALNLGVGPFTQDPKNQEKGQTSLQQIRQFIRQYPHVKVYAGHDDLENQAECSAAIK